MDALSLLNYPLLALQNYRHKKQLIDYCNANGYEERFGHKLTYYRLSRYPNEVQQFLNELQEEAEFQKWFREVEVQEPTQKPRHERQLHHNIMMELRD